MLLCLHSLAFSIDVHSLHRVGVKKRFCHLIGHGCGLEILCYHLAVRTCHGVRERRHVNISSLRTHLRLVPRERHMNVVVSAGLKVCHSSGDVVSDKLKVFSLGTIAHLVHNDHGVMVHSTLHVAQLINILCCLSGLDTSKCLYKLVVAEELCRRDGRKRQIVKRCCWVCPRERSLCRSVFARHNGEIAHSGRCAGSRCREGNVETGDLRQVTHGSHLCCGTGVQVYRSNAVVVACTLNKVCCPIERAVSVVKLHALIVAGLPACRAHNLHSTFVLVDLAQVAVVRDAIELSFIGASQGEERAVEIAHGCAHGCVEVHGVESAHLVVAVNRDGVHLL